MFAILVVWMLKMFMLLQLLFSSFKWIGLNEMLVIGTAKFTFGNSWLGWSSTGDSASVACSPAADRSPKRGNWHCCHHFPANRNQEHLVKMTDIGLGICLMSLAHRNWNTAMPASDDNTDNSFPYLQRPTDYPMIPAWNETVFVFHSLTKLIRFILIFVTLSKWKRTQVGNIDRHLTKTSVTWLDLFWFRIGLIK